MASKVEALVALPSQAGLNSSAPPTYLGPDELTIADNVLYGLNAERMKRKGFARGNTSALVAAANVTAMADFWRFGTSLTPTQKQLACAGGSIFSSADGFATSTNIGAFGNNGSLITNILTAQGFAVFSDGVNTPKKWDQTTLTALDGGSGTAPLFTAATYHLSRLFAIGIAATPSAFQVTAGGDITTWTGADTLGAPNLDQDDGDALLGISKPFHKRLYIFKGPNFGSIHEISGNTLSTLQHDRIFNGLPLQNHKGLITLPNDIFWLSNVGVHSLVTTQQYGDTTAAFLSKPIQDVFQTGIDQTKLNRAVGFWNPLFGIIGWWYTPNQGVVNSQAMVYHYLISDPTPGGKKFWSIWKLGGGIQAYTAQVMVTPSTATVGPSRQRLYIGGTGDGFVYAGDQPTLTDDNGTANAYTTRIKTGINLGLGNKNPLQESQMYSATTFYNPVGSYNHTLNVIVDNRYVANSIVMSGSGDTLG